MSLTRRKSKGVCLGENRPETDGRPVVGAKSARKCEWHDVCVRSRACGRNAAMPARKSPGAKLCRTRRRSRSCSRTSCPRRRRFLARSTSSEPRSWDARSQVRGVFRGPSTGGACPFLARALAQRFGRERVDESLAVGGVDGGVHECFHVRVIASPRRIHDARDAGDFARIVEPAHSIAQQALVDPEETLRLDRGVRAVARTG